MGKRELLLIVAFIFVGSVVYQVAAPAGPPGQARFSLSRLIEGVRRELRHDSVEAELTSERSIPLEPTTAELRVTETTQLEIVGEERSDVAVALRVRSSGADEADARALAKRTALKIDQTGSIVELGIDYPEEGRQRAELTLKVPKRLSIRLNQIRGSARLDGIHELFLDEARGDLTVTKVPGELRGTFQNGRLRADAVRAARLTARRAEIEINQIDNDATLDLSGGSLRAKRVGGRLDLTTNRTDVAIDEVGGEVRANAVEGRLELGALKHEARIDGRRTEVAVQLAAAAPLTAFTNEEPLTVRLPGDGGLTIDAIATGGEIRFPDALRDVLRVVKTPDEQRARGDVRGGGPALSLRVTRGDLVIKQ